MAKMDDMELLREYAGGGNEQAFTALVARHISMVHSVALRHVRDPQQAEEITQAVFVILARKAGVLPGRTILSGWLFHTARLTAANFQRTEIRRARREQEAYMQSGMRENQTNDPWGQMAPLLDEAVASLNETDRNAIVLRFVEGRDFKEVGEAMGATEDSGRMRVNRALEKLRVFLARRGVALSAAVIAGALSANVVQAAPPGLLDSVAVAAAKGTSLTTSTLIKGTLKTMAWTKTKTILVAAAVAVLAAGTAVVVDKKPAATEYRGTLKLTFPRPPDGPPHTTVYEVRLLSEPPCWQLSLTSTNGQNEVFASPQQTIVVYHFPTPPDGSPNNVEIKVFPGSRPLAERAEEHVWLALLSAKTYIGRELPLPDPGLGMAEPSLITQADGTAKDVSPRQMQWTNEFPGTRTNRIEGDFKWLAATNGLDGLNLPRISQMEVYGIEADGAKTLYSSTELVLDSVRPSSIKPIQIPRNLDRSIIFDYRSRDFSKMGGYMPMPTKQYDVLNGDDLEKRRPAPGT